MPNYQCAEECDMNFEMLEESCVSMGEVTSRQRVGLMHWKGYCSSKITTCTYDAYTQIYLEIACFHTWDVTSPQAHIYLRGKTICRCQRKSEGMHAHMCILEMW